MSFRNMFISTGSTLLDMELGGGYALGRIVHVYGDPSTGKTQLAIEAMANFHRQYPEGQLRYCDAEYAFDEDYAVKLGLPAHRVVFTEPKDEKAGLTLEDFDRQLEQLCQDIEKEDGDKAGEKPSCYVLDSLDSLPTHDEATTSIDKRGGYGTEKAKKLGEILRTKVSRIEKYNICVIMISQLRERIDAMAYQPKKTISGGKAILFYRAQALMLSKLKTLTKQVSNVDHAYGVKIRAKIEKNKVGNPHGEAVYDIIFSYGIDDESSCLDWLEECKRLHDLPEQLIENGLTDKGKVKLCPKDDCKIPLARYREATGQLKRLYSEAIKTTTRAVWLEIKQTLAQGLPSGKYDTLVEDAYEKEDTDDETTISSGPSLHVEG